MSRNNIYRSSISAAIITSFMVLFISAPAHAQNLSSEALFDASGATLSNFITVVRSEGGDVVGSPYLTEEIKNTTVTLRSDQTYVDVRAQYNAYTDKLEMIHELQRLELSELMVSSFEMELENGEMARFRNRVGVYEGYFDNLSYLEVLHEGDQMAVYKRYIVEIKEGKARQSAYDDTPTNPMLVMAEIVFMKDENGEFSTVNMRRRSILRNFGDYSSEVREFARDEDLDFRSERDFAKMVAYYETLL